MRGAARAERAKGRPYRDLKNREATRKHWTQVVARFEAAGVGQAVFASRAGVGLAALRYWIAKLRRERRPSLTAALTPPVRLVPVAVAVTAAGRGHLEVRVGGVRLRAREGMDPDYVAAVALALKRAALPC